VAEAYPRFVVNEFEDERGKLRFVITGGGISAGLDEALELVRLIFGEKVAEDVQTITQYFPRPPVQGVIQGSDDCPLSGIEA
jgi:transcriptional regulator GlxA family with amidase domain